MDCSGSGNSTTAPSTHADQQTDLRRGRTLGMDFLDATESGTFEDSVALIKAVGAEAGTLHLNWNMIETAPGTYADPYNALQLYNLAFPAKGMKLSLTIRPIDANSIPIPADLQGKAFNDPLVISRFNAMIDFVFSRIPDIRLTSLQIGNELDTNAGAPTFDYWNQYGLFLLGVITHVHEKKPGLQVGFTGTHSGFVTHYPSQLRALANLVDVVGVTYYPLNGDFTVKDPGVVRADFDALMALYPDKPVFFQEVGYPSGALCNSSEGKQAAFVQNIFTAWDAYATRIPFLSFLRLNDWSQAKADQVASQPPYNLADARFSEYLRTLGLRSYAGSGSNKPAYSALSSQAHARGW